MLLLVSDALAPGVAQPQWPRACMLTSITLCTFATPSVLSIFVKRQKWAPIKARKLVYSPPKNSH